MAGILHIKDSYYFEVPKPLWRVEYESKAEFPDVWVKLDPDYQDWEISRFYDSVKGFFPGDLPEESDLADEYHHWRDDHVNHGKPFHIFLESRDWFKDAVAENSSIARAWPAVIADRAGFVQKYRESGPAWDAEKLAGYNQVLSGKILIPQPFGELRNLYEKESGFCLSRFMVIEVVVAVFILFAFSWLAGKVVGGGRPFGRCWNLLEVFVVFIRDQIARPAIDHDHADDSHGDAHDEKPHGHSDKPHGHGDSSHDHGGHSHDGDQFVPLLCTLFFFVLGCNLCGMLPWVGAPTGAFGATFALACVTFAAVVISGMIQFGPVGFFLNQIPGMDLPLPIAVVIKPMILLIEIGGLLIKHAVLSIRLLANMVAGHLVLLAVMGLAFTATAAASSSWHVTAVIAVIGSTLFSCLELFVAFLQAYVFTFLSALFIGAAVHEH